MNEELKQREREFETEAERINAGRKPKFGDLMRNPWAGESNPQRDGYFVRKRGDHYEFTDKQGKFWETRAKFAFFIDATPPSPSTANLIDRLKSAIEGECDGLAVTDQQANAILAYVLPSPSTASEVSERAAFEQWCVTQGWAEKPTARDNGTYVNGQLQSRWLAWQARAALASKPVAREVGDLLRKLVEHYPNRLREMCCDGEPVGRKLVAAIAATQTTEGQHEGK